jgi:hypothetical protein
MKKRYTVKPHSCLCYKTSNLLVKNGLVLTELDNMAVADTPRGPLDQVTQKRGTDAQFAVAQVVEALCYESKGGWFDSRWGNWDFSLTSSSGRTRPLTEMSTRIFIHSFSSLSYDRSKASSKASSPYSAIQSFLFQMRVSSPFLKVIQ